MKKHSILIMASALIITVLSACFTSLAEDKKGYLPPEKSRPDEVKFVELTEEAKRVLELPNAAFVVGFDFDGQIIVYEARDEKKGGLEQKLEFPVKTTEIVSRYVAIFEAFSGSHCVDYQDSIGNAKRRCFPVPPYPAHGR